MVMAAPALQLLMTEFPDSKFTLIVKKGLEGILSCFKGTYTIQIFDKANYPGLLGAYQFGKKLQLKSDDYFICFPNSLSSALMSYASNAGLRLGYPKEGRGIMLTHRPSFPKDIHRVEQYFNLINVGLKMRKTGCPAVKLSSPASEKGEIINQLLVSFNSEAKSRRMPVSKAISILHHIHQLPFDKVILLGGPKDVAYNELILSGVSSEKISSLAGKTSLEELAKLMSQSKLLLTVDSGPSHLANALGLKTVVMHGADDELNTEAYNKELVYGLRYGQLPCEPCVKNICKLGEESPCLLKLEEARIYETMQNALR